MSEANEQIWPGCRGHTTTLFERHPGILNDHRESGPRFNAVVLRLFWSRPPLNL